jgi:hypothetical protein
MKKLLLSIFIVIVMVTGVHAANTVVSSLYGVTITNLSEDYVSPAPVTVWSIKFYPSATTDYVTIKLSTDAGQIITVLKNVSTLDPVIEYFPPNFRGILIYDDSASSISVDANSRLVILYRR